MERVLGRVTTPSDSEDMSGLDVKESGSSIRGEELLLPDDKEDGTGEAPVFAPELEYRRDFVLDLEEGRIVVPTRRSLGPVSGANIPVVLDDFGSIQSSSAADRRDLAKANRS